MTYKTFDIVLVPFPFVDSNNAKIRPALVLSSADSNNTGLVVLAMITSTQHNKKIDDILLTDLSPTGLSALSIIKMKIFSLDTYIIRKKIGTLSTKDQSSCKKIFKKMFKELCEGDKP